MFTALFFDQYVIFQAGFALVVIIGMFIAQIYFMPFAHLYDNILEAVLLIVTALVLFSGL